MRKTFCILSGLLFLALTTNAQGNFSNFIRYQDDIEDSEKLMTAYIAPFMKTATLGLTGGWYNTAKTHKMVGFDVTTSVSFLAVPDKDLFFNVDALGLKNFELASRDKGDNITSPDYPNSPTVLGPDNTPQFVYTGNGEREIFSGPPGINIKDELHMQKLPIPMVNVGLSLPKGTDLKIRFAPTIKVGKDGEFKFWGVGVMHDVKQYIPGLKLVPFDLAAFVGHTQMEFVYDESSGDIPGDNQHGVMKMAATTIQGVISKKISVVTFYGGFGYNIANSKLAIKGTYEVNDGEEGITILKDPITMDFGSSSARLTGGIRLKFAVFTFHGDYSFQKYHSINAGIGVSVN